MHRGTIVDRVVRPDRVAVQQDFLQRGQLGQLLHFGPTRDLVVPNLN